MGEAPVARQNSGDNAAHASAHIAFYQHDRSACRLSQDEHPQTKCSEPQCCGNANHECYHGLLLLLRVAGLRTVSRPDRRRCTTRRHHQCIVIRTHQSWSAAIRSYRVVVRRDGVATLCIPVATVAISPTSLTVDMLCPPLLPGLLPPHAMVPACPETLAPLCSSSGERCCVSPRAFPPRRYQGPWRTPKKLARVRKTGGSQKNAAIVCCGTGRLREYSMQERCAGTGVGAYATACPAPGGAVHMLEEVASPLRMRLAG